MDARSVSVSALVSVLATPAARITFAGKTRIRMACSRRSLLAVPLSRSIARFARQLHARGGISLTHTLTLARWSRLLVGEAAALGHTHEHTHTHTPRHTYTHIQPGNIVGRANLFPLFLLYTYTLLTCGPISFYLSLSLSLSQPPQPMNRGTSRVVTGVAKLPAERRKTSSPFCIYIKREKRAHTPLRVAILSITIINHIKTLWQ